MNKRRWWISYSNEETKTSEGVALTDHGDTKLEAIKWLKDQGVQPVCKELQIAAIEGPAYMDNLEFDVEWNKLPKDTLISRERLVEMGYRKVKASQIAHHPAVDIICGDCSK